jgi:hypothetical protein
MALNHHHPHLRVGTGLGQRISKLAVHGRGQGILALNPVEREGAHAAFGVNEDVTHENYSL